MLLTGDNRATAEAVAAAVGIDEVVAEVLPADKARAVSRLQAQGHVVAVAGDGVNDAPALAQADLGLAVGSGADVAIEASDLTMVSGDLRAVPDAIRLSRATLRTIRQNLAWAFAYNVAALPLAAAGVLSPVIAAAAMGLSSVSVVGNALRLRRFRSRCRPAGCGYSRDWLRPDLVAGIVDLVRRHAAGGRLRADRRPPARGRAHGGARAMIAYALVGTSRQLVVSATTATSAVSAATVGPLADGDPGALRGPVGRAGARRPASCWSSVGFCGSARSPTSSPSR